MRCPVCKVDLSPLDLASKNEHIEDCLENGPTILDVDESGRVVRKKNLPPNKQRKICPICDKTFQTIHTHYKACALKNDLPPQLMLDHWDKLNAETNSSKKFSRELLDNFIAKSIKEGRVGEQVDYAQALLLSMFEGELAPKKHFKNGTTVIPTVQSTTITLDEETSQSTMTSINSNQQQQVTESDANDSNLEPPRHQPQQNLTTPSIDEDQVLMQSNEASCSSTTSRRRGKEPKRFPLELVDDETKLHNIQLRIEREVAASQKRRYLECLKASDITDEESSSTQVEAQ